MRPLVAAVAFALTCPAFSQQITGFELEKITAKETAVTHVPEWIRFGDALALAKRDKKAVLLYFTAKW